MQKKIFDFCLVLLAILMLHPVSVASAQAQAINVTGVVVSASDGEPMTGVTVQVKGTTTGTITDLNGEYQIKAERGATLAFSFIGFERLEAKVNGPRLDVTLREDQESLEEVVVVGYGVQKKKLLTGATIQVKGEDIQKLNTNNPLQAMQGQTPGMSIVSNSGQPGEGMNVKIRGLGTIGSGGPLYLIDGVGGDISTLNPADIESIDVLKDAASAAIYGASAANGVVLITTKSGREGKTTVSFDGYWGWQNVARKAQMLDARQYMTIMDEQQINSGSLPYNWNSFESILDANGQLIDTDWVGQMFKDNAMTKNYSLGITGGNATSNYAISMAYTSQEGIVGGKEVSNYERYNFRVNSEHKVIKNLLKVGEQVSFIYTDKTGIGVGNQYNNSLRGAFGVSPLAPVYGENTYDTPYNATDNSDWYKYDGNPYGAMMTKTNNQNLGTSLNANVYAELTPLKGLKFRTVFGTVYGTGEYRSFSPLYHFSPYDYNDTRTSASQSMSNSLGMTWTNTLQYDWKIKDNAFNALLGMEAYRYQGTSVGGSNASLKEGFDDWNHAYVSNGTASTSADGLSASGSPHDKSRSVSYFGRLGWNYQEKYMINATLRCDGSSRFAKGHRFGWFPSVSAGWTLTEESWMQEKVESWLDFLKIRASWGQVGNQSIANYQYLAPVKNSNTHYLFGTSGYDDATSDSELSTNWGAYPSRVANPNVTWETSEQLNFGLDARLLGSRLSVVLDWYKKTSKDWLVAAPILATVGTGAPYINGGNVANTGFEFALTWNDRIGRDFHYTLGVNGAYNKNEVGDIPTEDGIIHGSTNMLYDNSPEFYRAQNGHSIGYFWGYKTNGIFQNQDEINQWISNGNGVLQSDVQPGDVKYIDVNHDGAIDDLDKVDLGNGMPKFTYGFNLGFDWKGIDFALQAAGAAGMQVVQTYRNHANAQANYTTEILNRWTGEGTSNRIPRVTTTNINWQFSDLYVHDADYLRISTVTLGYDLSQIWKQKYCSQCRIYVQAQNLLTFTKYNGMDPEIGTYGGGSDWASGIDVGYYPRPRTVMIGCNIKF